MKIGIGICSLNQLSLDFEGNCKRIIQSIEKCQSLGAFLRVGPELEICGYGCEDAFYEEDTVFHSWQVIVTILKNDYKDIIIDIGMPILKSSTLYNCRVIIFDSRIIAIRPKTILANNGIYRETRWFTPWTAKDSYVEWFHLPHIVTLVTGQTLVPFGSDIILQINSPQLWDEISQPLRIGFEICEELWSIDANHIKLFGERGAHFILNSSGSYWELRKLDRIINLVETITSKCGGVYAFSNLIGCDGNRHCYYGRSIIALNGKTINMTTSNYTLFDEVDVEIGFINPLDIINYRQQNNVRLACNATEDVLVYKEKYDEDCRTISSKILHNPTIVIPEFKLKSLSDHAILSKPLNPSLTAEEEIMTYGSLWLWDYLRKCPAFRGFIVPLSGGLDSSSVACLVYSMCKLLYENMLNSFPSICENLSQVLRISENELVSKIKSPQDICKRLLRCCYLKTKYSTEMSEKRAKDLAQLIGAQFISFDFTNIYQNIDSLACNVLEELDEYKPDDQVTIIQQNLQARLRMVLTYYFSAGNRLVLATGNVDEALVGYLTKYDCSSADINPIGSISKMDLRKFMHFFKTILPNGIHVIDDILHAVPSAELTGINTADEDDLGLTYEELSSFGRMRRGEFGCCGPYRLFCKAWCDKNILSLPTDPVVLADKVKRFFTLHAKNRHKQTVLTPSLHAITYSPDDNRFDHRQFLYNNEWNVQFKSIDEYVERIKNIHLIAGNSSNGEKEENYI